MKLCSSNSATKGIGLSAVEIAPNRLVGFGLRRVRLASRTDVRHPLRTTVEERAAVRQVREVRRLARNAREPLRTIRVDLRQRIQQALRVGMLGRPEYLFDRAAFHNNAGVHHED